MENNLSVKTKNLEQSLLETLTTYASQGKITVSKDYSFENAL